MESSTEMIIELTGIDEITKSENIKRKERRVQDRVLVNTTISEFDTDEDIARETEKHLSR